MPPALLSFMQQSFDPKLRYLLMLCTVFYLPATQAQKTLHLNTAVEEPLTNTTHDGLVDELVREALRRTGYSLIIENLPAERGLRSADNGAIDGEMARIKGIDGVYKNLIRVPEKVIDMSFVAFSKNSIDLEKGWSSLANTDVAYITGWKIYDKNVPDSATTTTTQNSMQLFHLLESDRTDLILYSRLGGSLLIKRHGLNNIKLQLPAFSTKSMFIYLNKKHQALVPKLAQALAAMKTDGSYDALRSKHLNLK